MRTITIIRYAENHYYTICFYGCDLRFDVLPVVQKSGKDGILP